LTWIWIQTSQYRAAAEAKPTAIPGMRLYVMKKRGVFKTMMSRRTEFKPAQGTIEEIEDSFALLKPYLRA